MRDCRGVAGIAGQMEPANSFDRDDSSGLQACYRQGHGISGKLVSRDLEPQARAAVRAGYGLSVKAAVSRVFVLGPAGGTHRKGGHRRLCPIIGQAVQDGETGPTMGAVGEGIALSATGFDDLGRAGGAGGSIGRDPRFRPITATRPDGESGWQIAGQGHNLDRINPRQSRRAGRKRRDKVIDPVTCGRDRNTFDIVPDATAQAHLLGQGPDERAKAHPLHLPAHPDEEVHVRPLRPRGKVARHATQQRQS